MDDEELLESLERHFMLGNPELTTGQFGEHRVRSGALSGSPV